MMRLVFSLAGSVSARFRPELRRREQHTNRDRPPFGPLVPLWYFQLHRALRFRLVKKGSAGRAPALTPCPAALPGPADSSLPAAYITVGARRAARAADRKNTR